MKTAEELNKEFSEWKAQKDVRLLKLYQDNASKEAKGADASGTKEKILVIENEILQKKAKFDKNLARIYERMYKAGASSDAKKARQERTHHLCNLGGLVEKAGLGALEPAALLGMLIQQAEYLASNPGIVGRWAERGDAALKDETK